MLISCLSSESRAGPTVWLDALLRHPQTSDMYLLYNIVCIYILYIYIIYDMYIWYMICIYYIMICNIMICIWYSMSYINRHSLARNGALSFSTSETHLVPSSDIQLDVWEPMAFTRTFSVDGGQLVSSFVLDSNSSSSQAFSPETWIIYIDTSASTADSFLAALR